MSKLIAAAALVFVAVAAQGCTAIDTANNAIKVVGVGTRVISSTGDVIFDHDGDGK